MAADVGTQANVSHIRVSEIDTYCCQNSGKKHMILNAFVMNTPSHLAAGLWRHPRSKTDNYKKLSFWTDLAKLLDEAGFHSMFIADTLGPYDVYKGPANVVPALGAGAQFPVNDPLLLLPAMAAATKNLIFGVTASATYEKPYALARRFSTVDHLTEGRVAWNIVTSYLDSAALNHGLKEQLPHDERYAIAHEYMDVVYKLWEGSFRDDAVLADRETGTYIASDAVRQILHKGKYFEVPGPHFCEPSPQRTPFLFQAGVSEAGNGFGGKHGEAIFIGGQTPEIVKKTVDNVRAVAEREGRDPSHIKVIVGIGIIVDANDEEAEKQRKDFITYSDSEGM
jgi:FMN-dependent oxidoreductase (nitrilotriacetate monooxygenase family)